MSNLFSIKGDVAVVTGAGTGIGEGTAHVLAEAGARVVCAGRRLDRIEQVAADIRAAGGEAIAVQTDVTVDEDVENLMRSAMDTWGQLDILVNNAGGSPIQSPLTELPREEWDATLALNLTAVWNCTRIAARHMRHGSRIVNVSSIAAREIVPGSGHYSAAKRGVNSLTESFARELGPRIRVNCVMPGLVPTEIAMKALRISDTDLPRLEQALNLPCGRLGTPRDLGAAILYLVSPASEWVSGESIGISGGQFPVAGM
jgi:NAD(P)-dependent dehydrogenase (short-subunit alcohol dehydrogenase family)